MDLALHQRAEGLVNHAVTPLHRLAGELRRHDGQPVVPAAAAGAFMPGMLAGVVEYLERLRPACRA